MKNTNQSITTVVRHFIKADKENEFKKWTKGINEKAQQFDGFEGLQLISPPAKNLEYIILFKFTSVSALKQWMDSKERKQEISKLKAFSEKEMVIGQVEGIDFWFETAIKKTTGAPPKWKMATLTWVAVFPGVVFLSLFYHWLFPDFNSIITTFLVTLTLVPLLTWLLMPNLVKLFKTWLF
jgi:antibiotic biosynthesis monooxygenase (ABM) superfamily enzyme